MAGSGSLAASSSTLTVNQSSTRAILDWSSFSIGKGGTVRFNPQGILIETGIGGIQAVAFWDYAHLGSVHNVADTVNHVNGSSAGLGLRYNFRANLIGKADYGWQLQHLPTADGRDHLVSFALLVAY